MGCNKDIKRLLCIVSNMSTGGAETFLMKVYRTLDKSKYQMDFYCMSKEIGYYDKEISMLGGQIYRSFPKSKRPIKAFFHLCKTVRKGKYIYVMRISQHSLATLDLLAAKFGGAKVLIQRSSNADSGTRLSRVLHNAFKWMSMTIPTIKIAPSTEAAEYTFGENCIKKGDAIIIKNAIPVEKFTFNIENREKIRNEFGIDNQFVIGHVGRFNNQKNHSFLIDIFSEIVKEYENSVLLLVGKGELENDIKNKIKILALTDKVIFTGVRSDVPKVLMGMDVFLFPSFFEGMPNTVIEAQATGLKCIISDTITREADVTNNIKYVSLDKPAILWAMKTLEYNNKYSRDNADFSIVQSGYDIISTTNQFIELIFKQQNKID